MLEGSLEDAGDILRNGREGSQTSIVSRIPNPGVLGFVSMHRCTVWLWVANKFHWYHFSPVLRIFYISFQLYTTSTPVLAFLP